ncbi:MAG: aminotransferase class V-fold PLP-dependent enzyme [Clostridia bacterium]|nr:aminotransferase class V-fold PLP-dependent enzyme [Clostridia bacterium]NLS85230.1 aminotransferase class V-fold PLP-dependent enzyme [Oscillospiraceae bacterium]
MSKIIYVDNAATTPVSKTVFEAMAPYFCELYGNPSNANIYDIGDTAKKAVDKARAQVAKAINCSPDEVYFTSCGSESDNWAIKGTARALFSKGKKHIITTAIEHHAVINTVEALKKDGFDITILPVDSEGFVTAQQVKDAIRPDTALVTVMMANNEIGTIEPIAEIGAVCREAGVWFHTDAVQAAGAIPIDVKAQNVDMLSMSAHKFNGPKGVGALYIKKGINPQNLIDGGAQERRHRAGTENVAGIVGLGEAIELATSGLDEKMKQEAALRNYVIEHALAIEKTQLNGPKDMSRRLPNNANIGFLGAESESILLFLDMRGICASSGSACASSDLDPSHVLLAIGVPHAVANCSLRISFGVQNTMDDAKTVCEALEEYVPEVRRRSAIWHVNG